MDAPDYLHQPGNSRRLDRFQALLEVLLLSGLVSSFLAALPFSLGPRQTHSVFSNAGTLTAFILMEAAILLVLLFLVLRSHRESLEDLGLTWHDWKGHAMTGVALVPVLFLSNAAVALAFQVFWPAWLMDRNPILEAIRSPRDLVLFMLTALVAGGIKEELQRGFILTRFSQHLGGTSVGLVLWSLVFGASHYVQGPQGVASATLLGLLFGTVYVARGSLLAPIVAHSLYDMVAILGFWFTRSIRG